MPREATVKDKKNQHSDVLPHTHTHTYRLLLNQAGQKQSTRHPNPHSDNIFKVDLPLYIGEQRESRPVGGKDLLKRMDLIQQFKSRRLSKGKIKLLQAREITSKSKQRKKRAKTELSLPKEAKARQRTNHTTLDNHQQTLKQHKSFNAIPLVWQHSRSRSRGPRDEGLWKATEKQRKSFLDKSALLAQMSHNHLLVEHSGEKYFQYSLRDRWKDELKAPQFIYQIREGQGFTDNKFINRLRKYRPDIKQRERLLLHGRNLGPNA